MNIKPLIISLLLVLFNTHLSAIAVCLYLGTWTTNQPQYLLLIIIINIYYIDTQYRDLLFCIDEPSRQSEVKIEGSQSQTDNNNQYATIKADFLIRLLF